MGKKYYLLECSPRFHQSVLFNLSRCGISYYSPEMHIGYRRRDTHYFRKKTVPMFPGYVFVLLDFDLFHPSNFSAMKNVYGLVSFGGYPSEVSLDVIYEVKQMEKLLLMNIDNINNCRLARTLGITNSSKCGDVLVRYACIRTHDRIKNEQPKKETTTTEKCSLSSY